MGDLLVTWVERGIRSFAAEIARESDSDYRTLSEDEQGSVLDSVIDAIEDDVMDLIVNRVPECWPLK